MNEISFDIVVKTYSIGGVAVSFNPTDPAVLKRIYNAANGLQKIQDEYEAKAPAAREDIDAWLALAESTDKAMRAEIDNAFETPVADACFGDVNCFSLSGGLPVWANLLFAVIDTLEKEAAAQKKLTNPRLEKYLKKYDKPKKR